MVKIKELFVSIVLISLLAGCSTQKQVAKMDSDWKKCISTDTTQRLIFADRFENNENNWKLLHTDNFLVYMTNGVMRFEKSEKNFNQRGCLWLNQPIDSFNTLNDFTISYDARFVKCSDVFNGIDFQWGNVNHDLYQLAFTTGGQVSLKRFTMSKESRWSNITTNVLLGLIKEKDFNHVIIHQIGNRCIICINGIEVINTKIERIAGDKIGIQQCLKIIWEMDNLEIRQ